MYTVCIPPSLLPCYAHVSMDLFYSWGLVKIAGPPLLVILTQAKSPSQADKDRFSMLIWAMLYLTLLGEKLGE